jgi:hypothetical protein
LLEAYEPPFGKSRISGTRNPQPARTQATMGAIKLIPGLNMALPRSN